MGELLKDSYGEIFFEAEIGNTDNKFVTEACIIPFEEFLVFGKKKDGTVVAIGIEWTGKVSRYIRFLVNEGWSKCVFGDGQGDHANE